MKGSELSSQKDDAILPSLSSHSNDSMNKNEEERDEAIDEQTDHLNQEQTSSETGSKTILTGPIPKPPQDVEVRQYWFKNWHKINVSKLHYSYWFIQILLSHISLIFCTLSNGTAFLVKDVSFSMCPIAATQWLAAIISLSLCQRGAVCGWRASLVCVLLGTIMERRN